MEPRYNAGAKGLAKYVRYNEVLLHIALNFTITGVKKKIVRSTEDFVVEVPL